MNIRTMTRYMSVHGHVEVIEMKNKLLIIGALLIGTIVGICIISGLPVEEKTGYVTQDFTQDSSITGELPIEEKTRYITQDSSEPFLLDTVLPKSPETAPVYRVTAKDSIFELSKKSLSVKNNIPSEAEAPALAERVLESYGGLPNDAVLSSVVRNTIKKVNTKTGVVEEEYPQSTQVIYTQQINSAPVIGPGAEINIQFGENGELLGIEKAWRYLEYDRDAAIIPVEEAYEKLQKGDTLYVVQSGSTGKKVSDIKLGYYAEHRNINQEYYTPVWIFYAAKEGQRPFPYPVDAMRTS
jgi:hypothetical protein